MMKKVLMSFVALLAIAFAGQANAMEIYVHYTNGTWPSGTTSLNGSGNLTLEMEASDSFENLKAKIEDKSGLTPDFITLSYGTYDNLPNDGTLNNYGITSGTTLNMSYNPPTHTVTFAEGTEDLEHWTINPGEAATTGVVEGTVVNISYGGTRKVKSVTAAVVPDAPPTVDLDNTTTAWADGSNFAVPAGGLTYGNAVTVSGNVALTLTEGETLTLNKGISLAEGATLTIDGTGTMNVNGTNNNTSSTVAGTGTIVLTSGTLNAKGGNGQGVGDDNIETDVRANAGGNAINGNVTVSGGTLTATGGNGGGVGAYSAYCYGAAGGVAISGSVTENAGAVTATGGNGGSIGAYGAYEYGGAGGAAIGGDATISGGTWTATDGTHGVNGDGQGGAGGAAVAGTVTDNR